MKDSWRVIEDDCVMEGEVYEILNRNKVWNVTQRGDFCNVGAALLHQTQVQRFACAVQLPEDFHPSILLLRHHRLILGTVGERPENFQSSPEMVKAVCVPL